MPFLMIFGKPMHVLKLNVPFVMSPSPLPWRKYLDGLFHHIVVKKTNTRNGRTKMHAKLLCQMGQLLTELKGCVKHVTL